MKSVLLKPGDSVGVAKKFIIVVTSIKSTRVTLKTYDYETQKPRATSIVPYGMPFNLMDDCQILINPWPPEHCQFVFKAPDNLTIEIADPEKGPQHAA